VRRRRASGRRRSLARWCKRRRLWLGPTAGGEGEWWTIEGGTHHGVGSGTPSGFRCGSALRSQATDEREMAGGNGGGPFIATRWEGEAEAEEGAGGKGRHTVTGGRRQAA
jgi:hypothetical protein